jgi:hypothetical protein
MASQILNDKPNGLITGQYWGTNQTAESLRDRHHLKADELMVHAPSAVGTCHRASRLTINVADAHSENDGNCALGGSGISEGLGGIRYCGWSWFS